MKKMFKAVLIVMGLAGLLMAGSDGKWFPIINFVGVGLMAVAVVVNNMTSGGWGAKQFITVDRYGDAMYMASWYDKEEI